MSYAEVLTNLVTRLSGVATIKQGPGALAETDSPPRIVFMWMGATEATIPRPPQNRGGAGNPPRVAIDEHKVAVELWGKSIAEVERLRAAVINAVRAELNGRRYRDGGTIPDRGEGSVVREDIKATLTLYLFLDMPQVRTADPPFVLGTPPTTTVVDATLPTVQVTQIDEKDTSGSIPSTTGDGIVDLGES